MLARILYLVLLTLVARLVFRALADWTGSGAFGRRGVSGRGAGAGAGSATGGDVVVRDRMVRDPVCGLNLPEKRAVAFELRSGEPQYFCSTRCRDAFVESRT